LSNCPREISKKSLACRNRQMPSNRLKENRQTYLLCKTFSPMRDDRFDKSIYIGSSQYSMYKPCLNFLTALLCYKRALNQRLAIMYSPEKSGQITQGKKAVVRACSIVIDKYDPKNFSRTTRLYSFYETFSPPGDDRL